MILATQITIVYVLQSGNSNRFKIGRTRNLDRRMKHLATGNPDRLTLFDSIETDDAAACETYLHHRLRSRRCKGSDATEFFELEPDELRAIIEDARAFLDDFIPKQREAERLGREESCDEIVIPGDTEWSRYRSLLEVRQAQDMLDLDRRRLEAELKVATGPAEELQGIATWRSHDHKHFDRDSLQRDYPDFYELFVVTLRRRNFRLL
jgi:Meiotically up-regulated gene 113